MRISKRFSLALGGGVITSIFVCSVLLSSLVQAESPTGSLNLTTSPLPISLDTKPGSSVSADLRVQNSGSQTETLKVDLQKFRAYGESGKPQLISREPGDDYFDWVHFSETTFTAEPGVWKTIKMTINVPSSAAYGYYYAVVFSRANNQPTTDARSNSIIGGSATLVLLDVQTPGAKKQVDVLGYSAGRKLYEFLPVKFTVRLRNSGVVHVAPSGTIFIMRGKTQVATIPVNADKGNILPGSNRLFTASWTSGFPHYIDKIDNGKVVLDKTNQSEETLKWDFSQASKLRIGHYTAKLLLVYDNGSRDVPVEGTLGFWVVPWRIIGLFVIALLLIGRLIYKYLRLKKRIKQLTPQKASK